MSLKSLLLTIPLIMAGVVLSAITYAAEESGEIICPPTDSTPIQALPTSTPPQPGSNAETSAAFRKAIHFNDVATVEYLLTLPNSVVYKEVSTGQTPLHVAVSACRANMVQLILAHPQTQLDAREDFGMTPLHSATLGCGRDVMDLLLAHPGTNPNITYTDLKNAPMGTNERRTPLHEAVARGNAVAAEALLAWGADPNPVTADGSTPLHIAADHNKSDLAGVLLRHGADPNVHNYDEGWTPLHAALFWSEFEVPRVMAVLLDHSETDPDAEDDNDQTALHLAVIKNSEYAVDVLLDHGADPNAEDQEDRTPLHLAARLGNTFIMKMLLDERDTEVNALDMYGYNPLHLAAFQDDPIVAILLLDHGADPLVHSDEGWDPLSIARRYGNHNVVAVLEPVSALG